MSYDNGNRVYSPATDKDWSSDVYQKAKQVVAETLSKAANVLQFGTLCEAMQRQYPHLCDSTIMDPSSYYGPYWRHLVGTAISALKKKGKVQKADDGWIWTGEKPPLVPPRPTNEIDKLAEEIKSMTEKLAELAKKTKEESPLPSHDEVVQKVKEVGTILGKTAETSWGPLYKHDCVWKDNPYASPKLVIEVCDKGNLDKDITSLDWAVTNWGDKGLLIIFEESDFQKAREKLAHKSHIHPLKADDMVRLHSILKEGNAQAVRSIFSI